MSERLAEMVRGLLDDWQCPIPPESNWTHANVWQAAGQASIARCSDLIAGSPELAEMRRDAERYRWLATVPNWLDDAVMENFDIEPLSKATLDAAIDAAQLGEGT